MRSTLVVLLIATAGLSGCFWWDGMMDDGDRGDPEFAFVLLGILVLVGVVLLAVNLSQPAQQPPLTPPPASPPAPSSSPTPQDDAGWQEVRMPGSSTRAPPTAAPKKGTRPSSKPRRRSP